MKNKKLCSVLLLFLITIFISLPGCEKSSKTNPLVDNSIKKYAQTVTLNGSVSDRNGPVSSGKIVAADTNGGVIASTELQSGGRYSIVIPAGTVLPIVLEISPGSSSNSGSTLTAVAVDPSVKRYEINPLSTAIAEKAKALGGYTAENMMEAALSRVAAPDANKTTGGFRGDPTKQYGGWH